MNGQTMPVVIFAGGRGTRLEEETRGVIPKPLVEVGGRPMLEHIVGIYAGQGFMDFVIAAGYKGESIFEWAQAFRGKPSYRGERISVVDTGLETQTGGRLQRLAELLDRRFMLTYGDGVADINLAALLDFHEQKAAAGALVTLTAVRPPSRWGSLWIEDGLARIFTEKPQADSGWINGGFYVVEPKALALIPGPEAMWEHDVLPVLASQRRLAAYQHMGFWQCLDTPREKALLDELWVQNRAPWARLGGLR